MRRHIPIGSDGLAHRIVPLEMQNVSVSPSCRRWIAAIAVLFLNQGPVLASSCPWPAVILDRLYLPFGLELFAEKAAAIEALHRWGEPTCQSDRCIWFKVGDDWNGSVTQSFHADTVVSMEIECTLPRSDAQGQREKLNHLMKNLEDWVVIDRRDALMAQLSSGVHFSAESKDARIEVKFEEREHTVRVSMALRAK